MKSTDKFSLLRTILRSIGLSIDAIDDIIDRITDILFGGKDEPLSKIEYPYSLRDDFLSRAEHSFFMVLKNIISDSFIVQTKVNLGDLFYVRSDDPSKYRIYTNKIDRKHVDFLVCDSKTVRPIFGIELDDKSHQRNDRQVRDEFVENVFKAGNLPLVRVPVKNGYSPAELNSLLQPYLSPTKTAPTKSPPPFTSEISPRCPKCGSEMVLRTAKNGANQGEKFWGCSDFPKCRGITNYQNL